MSKEKTERIQLHRLRVDGDTQPRAAIDDEAVRAYAECITDLPPVDVFRNGTGDIWMGDGFHRLEAHRLAGKKTIACRVRRGGRHEALLWAIAANRHQGLRFTSADKRRAVELLAADPECGDWSNRKIAEACGVSHDLVNRLRNVSPPCQTDGVDESSTYPPSSDSETQISQESDNEIQSDENESTSKNGDGEKAGEEAGESSPAPDAAEAKPEPIPTDEEGNHLPDRADVRAAFELRGEYRAIMQSFVGAKSKGLALAEKNPRINKQAFAAYCSNARSELKSAMPYAVCPYCRGEEGADCLACHGDGWVTNGMWVQAPEEMRRALRPRGGK